MDKIGSYIRQLRNDKGLTQEQLGELVGVQKAAVQKWENGSVQNLKRATIKKLAEIFEVSPASFVKEDIPATVKNNAVNTTIKSSNMLTSKETALISKYRELDHFGKKIVDSVLEMEHERCTYTEPEEEPKIRFRHSFYKVSAGRGFDLSDDDNWDEIEVPDTPEARKADFAITIEGDSMEPIFFNGDIVLVKQQDAVDYGQIGIFWLNGAGYIKKFAGDRLISLNEKYDDIILNEYDDYRCFGKVIGRV